VYGSGARFLVYSFWFLVRHPNAFWFCRKPYSAGNQKPETINLKQFVRTSINKSNDIPSQNSGGGSPFFMQSFPTTFAATAAEGEIKKSYF
jgi:hypothetical protein